MIFNLLCIIYLSRTVAISSDCFLVNIRGSQHKPDKITAQNHNTHHRTHHQHIFA